MEISKEGPELVSLRTTDCISTKTIADPEGNKCKVSVSKLTLEFSNGTVLNVPLTVTYGEPKINKDTNNSCHHHHHHQEGLELKSTSSSSEILICPVCSKRFRADKPFRRHMAIHKKQELVCKDDPGTCNASFSNQTSLTKHRQLKHGFKVQRDQSKAGKARKKAEQNRRGD